MGYCSVYFCQSVNLKTGIGYLKSTYQLFVAAGVPLALPQGLWRIGSKIIAWLPYSAYTVFHLLAACGSLSFALTLILDLCVPAPRNHSYIMLCD